MDSGRYNRHFRRRVVREWKRIRLGRPCTKFLERNGLFEIPHVLSFSGGQGR